MDNDRVVKMEREMADLQMEIQSQFDQILNTLAQQHLRTTSDTSPAPNPQVVLSLSMDTSRICTTRPATPPDFDGNHSKGRVFLTACQIYICLCPREFPDEQHKILWAMSYMKSRQAQRWTERILHWEQQPENLGSACSIDWEDFQDEFQEVFTPAHADAWAINCLETAAYHQKGCSLDDYIDEFQDLITDSGYTNPRTIIVKFHRGLNPR